MDNMTKIHHDYDQDFFRDREERILLYQARYEQNLDLFTGETVSEQKPLSKEESAWLAALFAISS